MKTVLKQLPFLVNIIFLVTAIGGFADASYLTISHYTGSELACGTSGGCNTVTTSQYATIGPIPVALLGALYYLTIIILTIAYFDKKQSTVAIWRSYFTVAGLLASLYFVGLQLFIIQQICRYCMVSAGTSTLLFLLGMYVLYKYKEKNSEQPKN